MIEKMTKYTWILLSSDRDYFLDQIRSLGVIDITRSVRPIDEASENMLLEISELKKRINEISKGSDSRLIELCRAVESTQKKAEALKIWGDYDKERLHSLGLKVRFYSVSEKQFDPSWEQDYALTVAGRSEGKVWFVIVGDEAFPLKELETPAMKYSEVMSELETKKAELNAYRGELEALKAKLPRLGSELNEKISDFNLYLAALKGRAEADDKITVFEGFAPAAYGDKLKSCIDSLPCVWFGEDASVKDNPPIKLKNNRFVGLFEVLTDMYGRPTYDGFDPTPFISVFFLLFFAMCMGDAGYGLILVAAGFLLKKVKGFSGIAPLVITLGVGTVAVGLFFHTFFSVDISEWRIIPEWFRKIMVPSKIAGYDGTMILALVVGIIHLSLAMIVKTYYSTRNSGFFNSLSVWGWTVLLVGLVILGTMSLAGALDSAVTKTAIIALGCVSALGIFLFNDLHRNPLKNIGAGLWETYNTVSGILGDVLSYLRLYALGLAGGMLGYAFNDLAGITLGDGGFVGWLCFILIVTIGHALNIAMAVLGAFVHPLRLNFLEFFKNSNYQGTGLKYNPLTKQQ